MAVAGDTGPQAREMMADRSNGISFDRSAAALTGAAPNRSQRRAGRWARVISEDAGAAVLGTEDASVDIGRSAAEA